MSLALDVTDKLSRKSNLKKSFHQPRQSENESKKNVQWILNTEKAQKSPETDVEKEEKAIKLVSLYEKGIPFKTSNAPNNEIYVNETIGANFPFPPNFRKINFDRLDPSKIIKAAEFIRLEQQKIQEPYDLHYQKLKSIEKEADNYFNNDYQSNNDFFERSSNSMSFNGLESIDLVESPKFNPIYSRTRPKINEVKTVSKIPKGIDMRYSPQPILKLSKMTQSFYNSRKILHQLRTINSFKNNSLKFSAQFEPPVQNSVKNSVISPKLISNQKEEVVETKNEKNAKNVASSPLTYVSEFNLQESKRDISEINVINGVIHNEPNIFNRTVGNSFAPGIGLISIKENEHPWIPHRFRGTIPMKGFRDNEIFLYYRPPFIHIKGVTGRTSTRRAKMLEEVLELPETVELKNLKFYRFRDGRIVIEETAAHSSKKTK